MNSENQIILPKNLVGPRTFFTDYDPSDRAEADVKDVIRKLKLQFLLKNKIIVGASSLFHDNWIDLLKNEEGLAQLLNDGSLVPALRENFASIKDFFYEKDNHDESKISFLKEHVKHVLPWNLKENSDWFCNKIFESITCPNSALRRHTKISDAQSAELIKKIDALKNKTSYFKRSHVNNAVKTLLPEHADYFANFSQLVYRISGARVVNAEGHFPQSSLSHSGITNTDAILSDESIFWDLFVDAVVSHLNSAVIISENRLDQLSFSDIQKIRNDHLNNTFIQKFDRLISDIKSNQNILDSDNLILTCEEIISVADDLKKGFYSCIGSEILDRKKRQKSEGLFEGASAILQWTPIGPVVGVLSTLQAIPSATNFFSPELSDTIKKKSDLFKNLIANKTKFSLQNKMALLDMYRYLVSFGLDN